jgi:hypothetical protein
MVGKVPDIWPLKFGPAASKNSVNLTAHNVHQNFGSYSLSALKLDSVNWSWFNEACLYETALGFQISLIWHFLLFLSTVL